MKKTTHSLSLVLMASLLISVSAAAYPVAKETINLVFIGNSITYGATLADPANEAPPIICRQLVTDATGANTRVFNGGHSGITTHGYLPGRADFDRAVKAAETFMADGGGHLYFSIMLGTNDSASSTTEGAPVSNATYRENMKRIIDELLRRFPDCRILVNYPLWYSPNTQNGARYLEEGLTRLHGYYPVLDDLVDGYDRVYSGSREAWDGFIGRRDLFTAERGRVGTFSLHPNATGAVRLAELWTVSLLQIMKADGIKVKK